MLSPFSATSSEETTRPIAPAQFVVATAVYTFRIASVPLAVGLAASMPPIVPVFDAAAPAQNTRSVANAQTVEDMAD